MSYDIYIGEAEIAVDDDDNRSRREVVHRIELPNAPAFDDDEMTGQGNGRHPGYGAWAEFCRMTGMHALFFDRESGLMRQHPGIARLRSRDLEAIEVALEGWRRVHSDARPGFRAGQDPILARLLWLEWWVRRALDHCKLPALYNR